MTSIDQLTTPLTLEECRAATYGVLGAIGVNTTTWKPGAVLRTVITGFCLCLSALSRLQASIVKLGFAALSTGDWLVLCAYYQFGVSKLIASFATGTITVNNTGGGSYGPLNPGDFVVSSAVSGKQYSNTQVFSIGSLQTGIAVIVRAIEAGSGSTASAGDISNVVSNLDGVQCTNTAAIIGSDDEQDPALQLRCSEKLGSLSPNGPRDAYAYVARSAGRDANGLPILITPSTPGTSLGINRVNPVPDGVGGIDMYVATATGAVTGVVEDLTTDLGAVDDLLQRKAAPLACTLTTHSAIAISVPVTYEIWLYQTSLTDTQIMQSIADALALFMPARPIGGDKVAGVGAVWLSGLETTIGSAQAAPGQSLGIFRCDMSGSNTLIASNQVPVLGAITAVAINRVARASL